MSTETATTPPTVIEREEQEERKYNLIRPTSSPIVLPNAGQRRFSWTYMRLALELDSSFDSRVSDDQSDWDAYDVYSQETWERWAR